jgi:hypothetical protein
MSDEKLDQLIAAFLKCNEVLNVLPDNVSRLRVMFAAQVMLGVPFTQRGIVDMARAAQVLIPDPVVMR